MVLVDGREGRCPGERLLPEAPSLIDNVKPGMKATRMRSSVPVLPQSHARRQRYDDAVLLVNRQPVRETAPRSFTRAAGAARQFFQRFDVQAGMGRESTCRSPYLSRTTRSSAGSHRLLRTEPSRLRPPKANRRFLHARQGRPPSRLGRIRHSKVDLRVPQNALAESGGVKGISPTGARVRAVLSGESQGVGIPFFVG